MDTQTLLSLKDKYGHEENLSAAIAKSAAFAHLLSDLKANATLPPSFELPVAHGHDDCEGRIDIFQPTTIGDVIVEVQYGTADSNHAKRLQNYASNFHSTAAVIWVAERFTERMLTKFATSKVPVLCATVALDANGQLQLQRLTSLAQATGTQEKRIKAADLKANELIGKMWKDCWVFDGEPTGRPPHVDKDIPSTLDLWIKEDTDKFLSHYPKKTRRFLLTHHLFQSVAEQVKDEMAFHAVMFNAFAERGWKDELPSQMFREVA